MKVLYCAIALTATGCASHSRVTVTTAPSPETATAKQPFDAKSTTALVPQMSAPEHLPGLIQSTNGDERAKQIQRTIDSEQRQDPFAAVPVTLQQSSLPSDRTVSPLPDRAETPFSQKSFPAPVRQPVKLKSKAPALKAPRVAYYPYFPPVKSASPVTVRSRPSIALYPRQTVTTQAKRKFPLISTLPTLPTANLAEAVEVSGIVVVGNVAHVIVKASNEASSRHIQVGQRLYNGQVLVKRIEMTPGTEPIVIFEENGVEVAKAIGVLTQTANPV